MLELGVKRRWEWDKYKFSISTIITDFNCDEIILKVRGFGLFCSAWNLFDDAT